MQYNAKASESVTYENIPLKEVQVSTTQQHIKPTAEDNLNMETNPSYLTVDCSNPQVKPEAEDNANTEEHIYFNVQ